MNNQCFLIVSHAFHKTDGNEIYSYSPYVREMNLWLKSVEKVTVVAPWVNEKPYALELAYEHPNIILVPIPAIQFSSFKGILYSLSVLPFIFWTILREMSKANHIHLRCPGNMGLIGCFVQMLFPWKKKTAKYAGNWDWKSRQPWSYRLQQLILRNRILTHNLQTLVYGEWPDQTKNIKPFFTASYTEQDKLPVDLDLKAGQLAETIRFAFVGTLTPNKRPLFCLEVVKLLKTKGYSIMMEFCGDGAQRVILEKYVADNDMMDSVMFHGNLPSETVKLILQESHFLLFASQSEGWPKAVAEAMWWGCVPITTPVSCVPQMLGNGSRGTLVNGGVLETVAVVLHYIENPQIYFQHGLNGMDWSRQFTLERFESEIIKLI